MQNPNEIRAENDMVIALLYSSVIFVYVTCMHRMLYMYLPVFASDLPMCQSIQTYTSSLIWVKLAHKHIRYVKYISPLDIYFVFYKDQVILNQYDEQKN